MSAAIPPDNVGPLQEAVRAAREEMDAGRLRIREMHQRGLDGLQVCGRLTSLVDGIVGRLFDAAAAEVDPMAARIFAAASR